MNLQSKKVKVEKPVSELYSHLTENLENYRQIMPSEVSVFRVDGDTFIFGLKGFPEVNLRLKDKVENQKVVFESASSMLKFELTCMLTEADAHSSFVQFLFNGEVNMMMRMMIEKPLQNFIDALADQVGKL
ncbi:MAG: SRPBCC family protein [Thermaurantimonas sp.]